MIVFRFFAVLSKEVYTNKLIQGHLFEKTSDKLKNLIEFWKQYAKRKSDLNKKYVQLSSKI